MKIGEFFRRVKQTFYSIGSSYSYRGLFGPILESFSGAWQKNVVCESRENMIAFSAVYACVSLIAHDISKLRIKLMIQNASGVWTETSAPAFSPVLRKPNAYQTRIQFLERWVISKLLWGNTYVYKIRDSRGVVVGLYVLDPQRVTPQVTDDGAVYYQINQDYLNSVDLGQYVPASDIIHDRSLCLFHPLVGISPIYACASSATQGIRIQAQSAKFFENMSRPSGQLTGPNKLDDITAMRLKKQAEENFSGGNIGRLLVAGDGLKYEPIGMPASDAQLIEQLKFTAEDVARAFGVPPHKLGLASVTHTSIPALNQDYVNQTLQHFIEAIELCLDEGLGLTKSNIPYGTELDLDGLLRMDQGALITMLGDGVKNGVMTPNEARFRFNLPKVAGGDAVYLQQQNYSTEALAKRDALDDPFATAKPVAPEPKPESETTPVPALPAPKPAASAKELAESVIAKFQKEARLVSEDVAS